MKRYKRNRVFFLLITGILIAAGLIDMSCGKGDNTQNIQTFQNPIVGPTSEGRRLAALTPLDNCDELLAHLKNIAIEDMEEKIGSNMAETIKCGGCCIYKTYMEDVDGGVISPVANSASDSPAQSASEYSTTNNQVVGVDEADFIKNDDSYIYILADNSFQIIDAWPPENASIISKVDIEGIPKKLFVASGRALIYSSLDSLQKQSSYPGYDSYISSGSECIYGYDCDFTGDNRKLKITIYDIEDPSHPVLIREIRLSGSYINARRIGTAIHTVVLFPTFSTPDIKYWPDLMEKCWSGTEEPTLEELLQAFDDLKQENSEIIQSSTLHDWLPGIQDTRYYNHEIITDNNLLKDCTNIYTIHSPEEGASFLTVLSTDISRMEDLTHTTVFGRPGAVYASPSSLYVAVRQQYDTGSGWYYDPDIELQQASTIHKFRITSNPASSQYIGSGVVKGRIMNQFSMDEYDDCLRIATTTGYLPSPNVHNTLSILKEDSDQLKVIGQVDNIAPKEDIRSMRFNGTRAFMVTFKKTDPLFVFDLSNPHIPKIEAELKIPGYSTYMHLMDENHLLTIGYDADNQGDFSWFQGIMLQVFDVSDMTAPSLLHKEVIGTRGSTSEAAVNHLAFNYFAPRGLLAIPVTICEGIQGGGSYGTEMTFSGLLVYEVTNENGFSKLGGVSHVEPGSKESCYTCFNWWTSSNSVVKRSIFMDDYVYSVALDQIKINHIDKLGEDLMIIHFL